LGVSRTLEAADEETLSAVVHVPQAVSQPFIEATMLDAIKQRRSLTADVDLTGRRVSATSTDYPNTDFGRLDDKISNEYQATISSMVCAGRNA
jgi:hypothetical protein